MNPDDVSRAEIFQLVVEIRGMIAFGIRILYGVAAVIALYGVLKVLETRRVLKGLDMTARHGAITDAQRARTDAALDENEAVLGEARAVLGEVKAVLDRLEGQAQSVARTASESSVRLGAAVARVPDETAQRVVDKLKNGGSHHDLPAQGT